MLRCFSSLLCGLWIAFGASSLVAEEPLHARIDQLIAAKFEGAMPSARTDDAAFLRRLHLDLAGRIPTADETKQFLADADAEKRTKLIDKLLAAPTYVDRMQELFHVMLMERRGENEQWAAFLRASFEQNVPWDQMVRRMLDPDTSVEANRGATFFITKRLENYGQNPIDRPGLTRDVGRLMLGLDLQCAQCHNHLFIDDYKQADFQGLYAVFLNLTINPKEKFPAVTEKPLTKKVEFVSVFDPTQQAVGPRIPMGKEFEIVEKTAEGKPYSPLALLASELPKADNALFSKNIANRLWYVMMGRGLVHPLDLHHSANPPSHPELLALLAQEFAAHGFDVKWMLRELALSETYQRGSEVSAGQSSDPKLFLSGLEKRLSAEQRLWSTLQATGERERLTTPAADGKPNAELVELKKRFLGSYANPAREPEDVLHPSVQGALFSLNDEKVLDLLKRRPGNLVDRLTAMSDSAALADELFLNVFTRKPTDEERAEVVEFLKQQEQHREAAIVHLAWAMLASTEFIVNH